MVAVVLNVAFGLVFVLGVPFNPNPNFNATGDVLANSTLTGGFGFWACPVVTSSMEWVQFIVLMTVFVGCCKLGRDCWPDNGVSINNVLSRNETGQLRMCLFLKMWFPAALVRFVLPKFAVRHDSLYTSRRLARNAVCIELTCVLLVCACVQSLASDFWRVAVIGIVAVRLTMQVKTKAVACKLALVFMVVDSGCPTLSVCFL